MSVHAERPMRVSPARRAEVPATTALAQEPFVGITTFERDSTPVSTPVWCAAEEGTRLARGGPAASLMPSRPGRGASSRALRVLDAIRLSGVVLTGAWSRRPVRPLAGETERPLPGDELVSTAKVLWQHGITIEARPSQIWPWLVQMGCRRAGWYSYDGLDNGDVRSAERVVQELQEIEIGDIFPMRPTDYDTFVVRMVEPEWALVLGDAAGGMSWAFVLEPVNEDSSRPLIRVRATYDRLALGLFLKVFWHPMHFAMERKQLLNLRRLAGAAA